MNFNWFFFSSSFNWEQELDAIFGDGAAKKPEDLLSPTRDFFSGGDDDFLKGAVSSTLF